MRCDIREVNNTLKKIRNLKRLYSEPLKKARKILNNNAMKAFRSSGLKRSIIKTDGRNTGIVCKIYDVSFGVYLKLAGVYRLYKTTKKYLPMQFFTTGTIKRHTKKGYNRGKVRGVDFLQGVAENSEKDIIEIFQKHKIQLQ